ncbi:hypothetical protein PN36_33280 [Candidatus Thiomargarita nelsonii]|uniref:Zeta toxin domain-containing protein n=1 Tax=Candidatus Thiomargarita nelsonii TaxID=1003181 RepID=A0A0A6P3R9_9GAMM|nr:hypothetical protein PN36_33280 [Candidatus Thiomargarita nelsonii]
MERKITNKIENDLLNQQSKRYEQEYKTYTEHLNNSDFMREHSEFLHFPESARADFLQALEDNQLLKAQKLYKKALEISIIRCEGTIGLTITENTQLVQAFRSRKAAEVVRLIKIAQKRRPIQYDKNDTCSTYKEPNGAYNAEKKQKISHPETKEEKNLTRAELHQAIIEKFLKGKKKPSFGKRVKVFLATGGLPGAGKGTALQHTIKEMIGIPPQEKSPEKYYVTVDPDAVKPYLPEYYNKDGTVNGNRVHRESGDIADMIRQRALKEGYSILYDASMRDSPDFYWYNKMITEARHSGHEPKVAFVYDGGEAWYRNSVIRDRALPAANYLDFMQAYDTFYHLALEKNLEATMYNNSDVAPTGKSAKTIVTYKNGEGIYTGEAIEKVRTFNQFRKALEKYEKTKITTTVW